MGVHTAKRPKGAAVVVQPDNELLEFGDYEPILTKTGTVSRDGSEDA